MVSVLLVIPAMGYILREIYISNESRLDCVLQIALVAISLTVLGYFESGQVISMQSKEICRQCSDSLQMTHKSVIWALEWMKTPDAVDRYLMGRQLCVIVTVFFISTQATFPSNPQFLPNWLQWVLISSGLPAVLVTMIFGQMYPQLMGEEYSVRFLCRPCSVMFIRIALGVEALGVCTASSHPTAALLATGMGFEAETGRGSAFRCQSTRTHCTDCEDGLELGLGEGMGEEGSLASLETSTSHMSLAGCLQEYPDTFAYADDLQRSDLTKFEYIEEEEEEEEAIPPPVLGEGQLDGEGYHFAEGPCPPQVVTRCCYCHGSFLLTDQEVVDDGDKLSPRGGEATLALYPRLMRAVSTIVQAVSGMLTAAAGCVVMYTIWTGCAAAEEKEASVAGGALVPILTFLLLGVSMVAVFYLEGLQIAILSVADMHHNEITASGFHRAIQVHALVAEDTDTSSREEVPVSLPPSTRADSPALKKFLIGRQIMVVLAMFTAAAVLQPSSACETTSAIASQLPSVVAYIWSLVYKSGIVGILFLLNTVQLPSQLIAKKYPLQFLNLWGCASVVNASLFVEKTGICHLGWMMFYYSKIMWYGTNNAEPTITVTWEEAVV